MRRLGSIAAALSLLAAPASGDDDATARKLREVRARAYEATRPAAPVHPDAELRKSLERQGLPPAPVAPPSPADATAPPAPSALAALEQQHDWAGDLARGGAPVAGLQLALGAQPGPYVVGTPHTLFLGLANRGALPRELPALPACGGAFARAEGVAFRVVADGVAELVVPLAFKDADVEHPHAPLLVDAYGAHRAMVDLTSLAASSPALAELVRGAARIVVTAEVPGLELVSNPVGLDVERR